MTFITDYEVTGKVKSVGAIVLSPNRKYLLSMFIFCWFFVDFYFYLITAIYAALTERLHDSYCQISIINILLCSPPPSPFSFFSLSERRLLWILPHVQTLKKVKTLPFPEAKEISCLNFSGDSKYIAAQGGKPDWVITMWSWEKGSVCLLSFHLLIILLFFYSWFYWFTFYL